MEINSSGNVRAGAGFFYEPTAIAGAQQDDDIVKREVFSPAVNVTRLTESKQATSWVNVSKVAGSGRSLCEVGRQDPTQSGCT